MKGWRKGIFKHSYNAWRTGKCKCDICKKASSDHDKERNKNPERRKQCHENHKIWSKNNPKKIKERGWRQNGIDPNFKYEDYVRIFGEQGGKCKVCDKDLLLLGYDKSLTAHVDHNHDTGKVRGLLCDTCNRAIGMLKDDPKILQRAITYLNEIKK